MDSKKSAASSSADSKTDSKNWETEEELDFSSPKFNPKRALFDPSVNVAFENVPTFSSLQAYREAIDNRQRAKSGSTRRDQKDEHPSVKPKSRSRTQQSDSEQKEGRSSLRNTDCKEYNSSESDERPARRSSLGEAKQVDKPKNIQEKLLELSKIPATNEEVKRNPIYEMNKRVCDNEESNFDSSKSSRGKETPSKKRNVFTRMEEMTGPLRLLTRCVEERLHVRVMTRGAVLVRSICRGYIVAFDKHFNMALIDVDEIYRRPAILGKIRARRSHSLKAAKKVLQEERKEQAKDSLWGKDTSASSNKDKNISNQQSIVETSQTSFHSEKSSSSRFMGATQSHSVYDSSVYPVFQFERDALMLGIAEENVEFRHVNQILIRGENVVLVSIIND